MLAPSEPVNQLTQSVVQGQASSSTDSRRPSRSQIREALAGPFAGMAAYKQFIIYKVVPSKSRPGKMDKLPCDLTGKVVSAHDPNHWMDAHQACSVAEMFGEGFGVGFAFTEADPFWFLDIDQGIVDGQWSQLALTIFGLLPGCAAEISSSLKGGHIFGTGKPPAHGCKNEALGLEFYHTGRFVALTGISATGDCRTDASAALPTLVATYFPADAAAGEPGAWSEGPCEGWNGPAEDDELIRRALLSKSTSSAFGGKASFKDLWEANETVLGANYPDPTRAYDGNRADAALAQHLAFWTGNDCERMQRIMERPDNKLSRDKYDRKDYLPRTILGAVARQSEVLQDKPKALPVSRLFRLVRRAS